MQGGSFASGRKHAIKTVSLVKNLPNPASTRVMAVGTDLDEYIEEGVGHQ